MLAPHTPGSHTPAPGLRHCQEKEATVPPLLPSLFGSLFFFHSHSALSLFPKAGVWRPHPETIFQKTRQGRGFRRTDRQGHEPHSLQFLGQQEESEEETGIIPFVELTWLWALPRHISAKTPKPAGRGVLFPHHRGGN